MPHSPFVEVMVNALLVKILFLTNPTAVQFPGDAHDTEVKSPYLETSWTKSTKTAGRASAHNPFVDVMVNPSKPPVMFLYIPTAVQFPGEEHDTEFKPSFGAMFWEPALNCAGRAKSHTPFAKDMVKAS